MDHVRTKLKREKTSDLAELRARLQGNGDINIIPINLNFYLAYYAALIKGDYVAKPPRCNFIKFIQQNILFADGDEPKIEIVQNIGVGFSGSDALRDQFRHDSNSKLFSAIIVFAIFTLREERLTLHKLGNWLEESINHLEEPEPELKKKVSEYFSKIFDIF